MLENESKILVFNIKFKEEWLLVGYVYYVCDWWIMIVIFGVLVMFKGKLCLVKCGYFYLSVLSFD